jgi:hypothetical protein
MKSWQQKVCLASCLFFCASLAKPGSAQQTESLQPVRLRTASDPPPAPKHKLNKVWTEDSIAEVRTPADKYLDEKEAVEASTKAAPNNATSSSSTTPENKGVGAPPLVLHIPSSAEETQKAIDQRKELADNFHNLLSNAQERLQTETDPKVRTTLAEKAKLLDLDINTTNSEISTLQKALDDYHHGRVPEQPKPKNPSKAPDPGKTGGQNSGGVVGE